jgi:hypothetical protein
LSFLPDDGRRTAPAGRLARIAVCRIRQFGKGAARFRSFCLRPRRNRLIRNAPTHPAGRAGGRAGQLTDYRQSGEIRMGRDAALSRAEEQWRGRAASVSGTGDSVSGNCICATILPKGSP